MMIQSILLRLVSVLFFVCVFVVTSIAQEEDFTVSIEPARHALYAEIAGQGILYSLNYEYRVSDHVSLRAGFSSWDIPDFAFLSHFSYTGFPLMVNWLVGSGDSRLEIGAGVVPSHCTVSETETFWGNQIDGETWIVLGTGTFGYRYQPLWGGVIFRAGITPFVSQHGAAVSGGLSLGFGF
jgi:hypothetical protein